MRENFVFEVLYNMTYKITLFNSNKLFFIIILKNTLLFSFLEGGEDIIKFY